MEGQKGVEPVFTIKYSHGGNLDMQSPYATYACRTELLLPPIHKGVDFEERRLYIRSNQFGPLSWDMHMIW